MRRSKGPRLKKAFAVLLATCLTPWQQPMLVYAEQDAPIQTAGIFPNPSMGFTGKVTSLLDPIIREFSKKAKNQTDFDLSNFVGANILHLQPRPW